MAKFTDEELAMLTEDERRAMEELGEEYDADNEEPPMDPDDDDEFVEEEGEADDDDATDDDPSDSDDDSDDADDADDQDEEDQSDDDAEQDGKDEGEGDDGGADTDDDEAPAQQPQPLLNAELPEGYEQKLADIETRRGDLDTKFDDGDLDTQEYRQALKSLEKEESAIQQQVFKAQLAQEMRENQERQAWIDTVTEFLDDNPAYREKDVLYTALDAKVKAIANSEEGAKLTGRQILRKAHQDISEQLGLSQEKAQAKKEGDKPAKPVKQAKKRDVPPTLGKVPAADMTDTSEGGQFAKLDKLSGLELEKELSRLSRTNPRLVDEYMSR